MPKEKVYKPIQKPEPIYAGGTITPPKFMPSYYEWLFKNAEQIIKTARTNTNAILYTVPKDKILFIISCYATQDTTSSSWSILYIDDFNKELIEFRAGSQTDNSIAGVSYNFSIPIKIEETQKIGLLVQGVDVMISAGFVGFLVSKKNIPQF